MAKRYRRKNAGRSKRSKRSKRTKRGRRRPNLPLTGFPKIKVVKLRYCHEIELINTGPIGPLPTSIVSSYVANGPDKPWVHGITHQPKGYDEWNRVYAQWQVLGSKITVKCTAANSGINWGVTRVAAPQQMTAMDLPEILETRMQKGMGVMYTGNGANPQNTPMNKKQYASFSSKRQFGPGSLNIGRLTGTQNEGLGSGNPEEGTYYDIWQCPTQAVVGSPLRQGNYLVQIDYIMMFTEPRVMVQS